MIVQKKIINPICEALTYEDIMGEITPIDDFYWDFRGHRIYKGVFPDTWKVIGESFTIEPPIILVVNRKEFVKVFYSLDALRKEYDIGAI